jgi:hypothetical protein
MVDEDCGIMRLDEWPAGQSLRVGTRSGWLSIGRKAELASHLGPEFDPGRTAK